LQIQSRPFQGCSGHQAGRLLLEQMYRCYTDKPMPTILIAPMGKPYFAEGDLHFSISHTKDRVFCALHDAPIGIDAEDPNRPIRLELAKKILSPEEFSQWENAPDRQQALLRFWVLKEARAKFLGTGIQPWPNDTNFSLDDPRVCIRDGCLVAVITE